MDEFFSWQMLATFAGATAATGILTQFLKNLIPKLPTQWLSYLLALVLLCAATAAIGDFTDWTSWAILPLNAALVSMASNGAFAAVKRAAASLPEKSGRELCKLWEEYNACETPEARLVKALDKAETILQHNQGANPPEFDYAFNLEYGKKYFEYDPLLRNLRALLDEQTRERVLKQEQRC